MNYLPQISFFFGAIGAFNSLILALFLLFNKSYSKLQNKLFSLFLLVLSIRVLHSLFYAFSTNEVIWPIQLGPSYFLLISPLLFSYILSVSHPTSFWVRNWKNHILFWGIVAISIIVFIPFKKNVALNKETILPLIYIQWFAYFLVSILFVAKRNKFKKSLPIKVKWLLSLLFANLIIWMSFALVKFDYFVTGSIVFSTLFYVLFFTLFLKKDTYVKIFEKNRVKKSIEFSTEDEKLIERLSSQVFSEKLFTDPNLKIADIANKLSISRHELSKLINDSLDKNFTDYINEYRVEEAKSLIMNNSLYTIEAIGNQSGFNSKSAFYKAFKKVTDTTPAKFKKQKEVLSYKSEHQKGIK